MKKLFFIICLMAGLSTYAQSGTGFGLKGGLNFGSSGDGIREDIGNIGLKSDSKVGFHVGAFGKIELGKIYLRPELVYTKLNSEYDNRDFKMSKLDMPLLVGLNLFGPIHVFAGPALQYVLDTDLKDIDLDDVKSDFTVGFNVGAGFNLSESIGVDLRYERGFSKNQAKFIDNVTNPGTPLEGKIDTRPSQLVLGLSYKF